MPATHPTIRVLLIDDDSVLLWGLSKLINGEWPRMSVTGTATNFDGALRMTRLQRSDVVVLDAWLGEDNCIERLPEIMKAAAAPVLVFTGSLDMDLHRQALAHGASAVVLKHQPAAALLHEIGQVYETRSHRGAQW